MKVMTYVELSVDQNRRDLEYLIDDYKHCVVIFGATWCGPCVTLANHLKNNCLSEPILGDVGYINDGHLCRGRRSQGCKKFAVIIQNNEEERA